MTAPEKSKAASSQARLRRHRAKLATEGCQRLEVSIGADVVAQMRALAQRKGRPLWKVVEDACEEYARASGNDGVISK